MRAFKAQVGRARRDGVLADRDADLDHLLAAFGAVERGVEEGHHAVGGRAYAQRVDTGGGGRIAQTDDQRDERHHDEQFQQRDAALWFC